MNKKKREGGMDVFKVGDVVMNGYSGLCRIKGVQKMSFGSRPQKYFVLVPVYEPANTIYIPVQSAEDKLRYPLTHSQIETLIQDLPEMDSIWIDDMKRRKDAYTQIIHKGDPKDLASLIRTIYTKVRERQKEGKHISDVDLRQLDQAEKVFNGELAYGLGVQPDQVTGIIRENLGEKLE